MQLQSRIFYVLTRVSEVVKKQPIILFFSGGNL